MTTLLGGARSGKSDIAVNIGTQWKGEVVFVATAEAHDQDMSQRIATHIAERPSGWETVERPLFSASDADRLDPKALVIVDCLTLLVSNMLLAGQPELAHITDLAATLADRRAPSVVVSNEVGLGVHPGTELGGHYRDLLGRANRIIAEHSQTVLLVFAGRVLPLVDVQISMEDTQGRTSRGYS